MKIVYKTAIVHDLIMAQGGAESTLESIYNVFPSTVYTLVLNKPVLNDSTLSKAEIKTSFIQTLPWSLKKYRSYLPLYPYAVEQFDLDAYDIVLSSSFVVAKGAITNTEQLHICYLHNPIRPAWELYHSFLSQDKNGKGLKGFFTKLICHYLRNWDVVSANRVDFFIANSAYTARRIKKLYNRESIIIYPPVNIDFFKLEENKDDYFVTASRMVYHKRIDAIVDAFRKLPQKKLIVLGDGPELSRLKKTAPANVRFLGNQPKSILAENLQKAKAFLFAAHEDFGIAPIEAMACGTPVLAYGKGGCLETIISGETGMFFDSQDGASIAQCIRDFELESYLYNPVFIRKQAEKYSKQRFEKEFRGFVNSKAAAFFENNAVKSATPASI